MGRVCAITKKVFLETSEDVTPEQIRGSPLYGVRRRVFVRPVCKHSLRR